jgi:hypothetical protein
VQVAERVISEAIVLVLPERDPITPDDIDEFASAVRKDTLASLLKRVRSKATVEPEFNDRLAQFLANRNAFIHRLIEAEGAAVPPPGPAPKVADLALRTYDDARYITRVFADLIVQWADALGLDGGRIKAFRDIAEPETAGIAIRMFSVGEGLS